MIDLDPAMATLTDQGLRKALRSRGLLLGSGSIVTALLAVFCVHIAMSTSAPRIYLVALFCIAVFAFSTIGLLTAAVKSAIASRHSNYNWSAHLRRLQASAGMDPES